MASPEADLPLPEAFTTSTGHGFSEAQYLDRHFLAAEPEYQQMIRSVGFQPGWHILDAGSGGGAFLPLISTIVGATGSLSAIDLAPENVATIQTRIAAGQMACPTDAQVASVTTLPFPDQSLDGVWCANVFQYLTNAELQQALTEFRRVVRPGGLIALKEFDGSVFQFYPPDPLVWWRFVLSLPLPLEERPLLRGLWYHRRLSQLGLVDVWQRCTLIERRAPLRSIERAYMADMLSYLGNRGQHLSEADQRLWQHINAIQEPDHVLNHPDYYWREGAVVAVGRMPAVDAR